MIQRIAVLALYVFAIGCGGSSPSPRPSAPADEPPPPNGSGEIAAARDAFREVTQFSLTTSRTTPLGEFTQVTDVDCEAGYYHYRYTKELSAQGIEAGTTQLQGRPKARQEEERLFADRESYSRYSGTWENAPAGSGDARPDWAPSNNSYDPAGECDSYRQPNGMSFLPFEKILSQKITYQATFGEGDEQCHEFTVAYPDLVDSDTMTTSTAPGGGTTSYRQQVTKPVESTICIGVADHLPWTVEKAGITYTFSYESFDRLRMPKF